MGPAPTIRPERPEDAVEIASVVEEAFESIAVAELVAAIRASEHFFPELSLVAEVEGHVVGHVMISRATLDDGVLQSPIMTLSPLAVAPGHQRRGIGAALVRAVTTAADERGEPFVVLEGSPIYYGRLGFEPAAAHGITLPLPSWASPAAAQLMRLAADVPTLRGHVVYPSAFDIIAEH